MQKTKTIIENIDGQVFKIDIIVPESPRQASFSHYFQNHKNGVSKSFKKDAINFVKDIVNKEHPGNKITTKAAKEALQYLILNDNSIVPFPAPEHPKFKIIDLFAGIGGFRLALQNLGGKCVFTSEWDKYSKKTYRANFGEIPFGDITEPKTKSYIPDGFDVLRKVLGVTLTSWALRLNLFARASQKGFPLQSLTQNAT